MALGVDDVILSGGGNDTICAGSARSIDGGAGNDRISFTGSGIVHGGSGNDTITETGSGRPTVYGDSGNDVLSLGRGGGKVYGGSGNDILRSRGGSAVLDGGLGTDIFSYPRSNSHRTTVRDKPGDVVNGVRVRPAVPVAGGPITAPAVPGMPSAPLPPAAVPVPTSPPSLRALISEDGVTGVARVEAGTAIDHQGTTLDLAATPGGYPIRSWQLSFGDGAPAWSGPGSPPLEVVHRYYNQGSFDATLAVTDTSGFTATNQLDVDVADAPTAELTSTSPNQITVPNGGTASVSVTLAATAHGGATLTSYDISWGDGNQDATGTPAASMTFTHVFRPGKFTISGTVVDDHGGEGISNRYERVEDSTVHPNLFVTGSSDNLDLADLSSYGNAVTSVSTDSYITAELLQAVPSSGATITSENVDWGDGSTPTAVPLDDPAVNHTYALAGDYMITASVTDSAMPAMQQKSPMSVITAGTQAAANASASVVLGSPIDISTVGTVAAAGARLTGWELTWSDGLVQSGTGSPPAVISRPTSSAGRLYARYGVADDHTDGAYDEVTTAVTGSAPSGEESVPGTWLPATLGPQSGYPGAVFLGVEGSAPSTGHDLTSTTASFGDGSAVVSTPLDANGSADTEHDYSTVGSYDASLVIADSAPSTTTNTYTVDLAGAPTLTLTASDLHPKAGEEVTVVVAAGAGQGAVADYYTEALTLSSTSDTSDSAGNGLPPSRTFTMPSTAGTVVTFSVQTFDNHGGICTQEVTLTAS